MLGKVGLLSEAFATLGTRIRSRFDVDATVLEQGALLFELLLADWTAHVQWHSGGPTVLDHVRKHGLTAGGGCSVSAGTGSRRWLVVQVG